jgi:hypothetical protein
VEWRLQDSVPSIPFESSSILQLALEVIRGFSPRSLSAERRIGAGCIQRPPEAQYQDEFYRNCHACSKGSLVTFPEYGTAQGRIDFYIPSKEWGVELLRDGNELKKHTGRFSETGSYVTTLALSDYIILDFHNTRPKRTQPSTCIICPSVHFPFCQANLIHSHGEIVPRCIQQGPPGGVRSGPHAANCRWWRTEAFVLRVILNTSAYGQDPQSESSSGFWLRDWYISNSNIFKNSNQIRQSCHRSSSFRINIISLCVLVSLSCVLPTFSPNTFHRVFTSYGLHCRQRSSWSTHHRSSSRYHVHSSLLLIK